MDQRTERSLPCKSVTVTLTLTLLRRREVRLIIIKEYRRDGPAGGGGEEASIPRGGSDSLVNERNLMS